MLHLYVLMYTTIYGSYNIIHSNSFNYKILRLKKKKQVPNDIN